jgi:Type IV secretion-system coupling protein DNA-binding domain
MTQWLIDLLRRRAADRTNAVRAVGEIRSREFRELAAAHDAFVPEAGKVKSGMLLGGARSSDGSEISIRLGWGDEYAHWCVQGGTGSGKTAAVSSLLQQQFAAGRPFGVVDCKGDLFASMIRTTAALSLTSLRATGEARRKRIVVVNPFSDHLAPLNVCRPLPGITPESQAYEVTLALSRLFDSSLGIHMENLLRHLVLLLMESRLTLNECPLMLQDDVLRGVLASRSANPMVKQFFLRTYDSIPQVSKDALLNRLHGLLLAENLRLMLGADDLVDFKTVFDQGDYLLVFLGKGPGVPEEQVEVLGSLVLQLLFQAIYSRGTGARDKYVLAMDEFFHLLEAPGLGRRFETALTTARSFGLALLLVSHNFAQLPATLREIVLGNSDLVALFRTSGRNAGFFGDCLPEVDIELLAQAYSKGRRNTLSQSEIRRHQIELLQRLPSRTMFWYDRRKPHRAVRVRVPDLRPPHEAAGISERELERIISEQGWEHGAISFSRDALRAQIEARAKRLHELIHAPIALARNKDEKPKRARHSGPARLNLG